MKNYLNGYKKKFCQHCKKNRTPEGHDGCMGTLKNVMNACCGHGENRMAYVQFNHENYDKEPNKIKLNGEAALKYINHTNTILKMEKLLKIKEIIDTKYNCDISKKTRKNSTPDMRKIYSKIAREKTGHSLAEIGYVVNRNHSSVFYEIRKAEDHLQTDKDFKSKYEDILEMVNDIINIGTIDTIKIEEKISYHKNEIVKLEAELKKRIENL